MIRRPAKLPIDKELFLSMISGSEAGIATTAAIIVGLTIGTADRDIVIVSGSVSVLVQAFNSAITTIVTSHTLDEIEHNRDMDSLIRPLTQGGIQFLTHITAGLVVLIPMLYVRPLEKAMIATIAISLVLMLWVGLFVGRIVRHTPLRNSIQSLVLGMLIIIGGFLAGFLIN